MSDECKLVYATTERRSAHIDGIACVGEGATDLEATQNLALVLAAFVKGHMRTILQQRDLIEALRGG